MNIIKSNKYVDTKQEETINIVSKELQIYVETQGTQTGVKNIPTTESELKVFAMNKIESSLQGLIESNHQTNLPISGRIVAQKIRAEATSEISQLQSKRNDEEHTLKQLEEQKKFEKPDIKKQQLRRCVHFVVGIISATEGYFTYEALRHAFFPFLAAFITALTVALGLAFGTHFFASTICRATTKVQRIIRYALILIPTFIFFYFIGHLRADAYNNIINLAVTPGDIMVPASSNISGWNITLFSYCIFLLSFFFSIWVYKSKEEREQEKRYEEICNEIRKCQKTIKELEVRVHTIADDAHQKESKAMECFEYAVATEKRLQAMAKQLLVAFIDKNMRHRTDGLCPVFFSTHPPFHFTTFFNHNQTNQQ